MEMRRSTEPLEWGVTALAAAIRAKKISAVEYALLMQSHAQKHAGLHAFISQDFDKLRDEALQADRRLSRDPGSCGPLHGVPVALKDNIDTVDLPTSGGTPALKNNVPPKNAPVWQKLADAGALLAGKANMHELASGGSTDNIAFGRAGNPYDPTRTAGGSSGGSAVAVAARLTPAALGTDTGGSIRVPAALTGLVGLRPTWGRYPGAGIVPLAPSFDTAGPMARSVADLALIDGAVTGETAPLPKLMPKQLRFGVDRKRFFEKVKPEISAVIDAAMNKLARAGAAFVDVEADPDRARVGAASGAVYEAELVESFEAYLAASAPQLTWPEVEAQIASPTLKARLDGRMTKPKVPNPEAYRRSIGEQLPALHAAYATLMAAHELDALIAPGTPDIPLPFAGDDNVIQDGQSVSSWLYFIATSFAPPRGTPSLTIPAGLTASGFPAGLFLEGWRGGDRKLLAVAQAVESVLDVSLRPLGI